MAVELDSIRVKPLRWESATLYDVPIIVGIGLGLRYQITSKVYGKGWVGVIGNTVFFDGGDDSSEEDAKVAAQSDFEGRVKGYLVVQTET